MPTGTVKWFNAERGFGFITPDEGAAKDLFVHQTGMAQDGGSLKEGARVSYETEREPKGTRAVNVKPV